MLIQAVTASIDSIISSFDPYGTCYLPLARKFLALAVTFTVLEAIYHFWLGKIDVQGLISKGIGLGLVLVIPLTLVTNENWKTTSSTVLNFFQVEMITPLVAASPGGIGGTTEGLVTGVMQKIEDGIWSEGKVNGVAPQESAWEKTLNFLSNPINNIASSIFMSLTELFFRLILVVVSVVVGLSLLMALYFPLAALKAGVVFGPLLIVGCVNDRTSSVTSSWIKFMIGSGVAMPVGVLMGLVTATAINGFYDGLATFNANSTNPWTEQIIAQSSTFFGGVIAICFGALLMHKAQSIADGMTGGGGGGGSNVAGMIVNKVTNMVKPSPPGASAVVKK